MTQKFSQFTVGSTENKKTVVFDFEKDGHLLIAEEENNNRTEFIKLLLRQLNKKKDKYGLILCDIKGKKYKEYTNHIELLNPIITDVKAFSEIIEWLCLEMERRYNLLGHFKVKNFNDYNKNSRKKIEPIFLVVDDLAAGIFFKHKRIKDKFWWLLVISKAVGIYFICAISDIKVKYLPGIIQASFINYVAFKMNSRRNANYFIRTDEALNLKPTGEEFFLSGQLTNYSPLKIKLGGK
jgi:DNA segregation ATPase FtsK/SpoIIIE-like protein